MGACGNVDLPSKPNSATKYSHAVVQERASMFALSTASIHLMRMPRYVTRVTTDKSDEKGNMFKQRYLRRVDSVTPA